jgi:hypothetical protein
MVKFNSYTSFDVMHHIIAKVHIWFLHVYGLFSYFFIGFQYISHVCKR